MWDPESYIFNGQCLRERRDEEPEGPEPMRESPNLQCSRGYIERGGTIYVDLHSSI
jgi:hypothetical protein